ncbi:hypothetical protein H4582DRAFT_1945731 [Lactarius indigo]|nr:hypothetical protein H4582DRAFT_1945731 [Lactarius indigo]
MEGHQREIPFWRYWAGYRKWMTYSRTPEIEVVISSPKNPNKGKVVKDDGCPPLNVPYRECKLFGVPQPWHNHNQFMVHMMYIFRPETVLFPVILLAWHKKGRTTEPWFNSDRSQCSIMRVFGKRKARLVGAGKPPRKRIHRLGDTDDAEPKAITHSIKYQKRWRFGRFSKQERNSELTAYVTRWDKLDKLSLSGRAGTGNYCGVRGVNREMHAYLFCKKCERRQENRRGKKTMAQPHKEIRHLTSDREKIEDQNRKTVFKPAPPGKSGSTDKIFSLLNHFNFHFSPFVQKFALGP